MTLAETVRQKLAEFPARSERHDLAVADEGSGASLSLVLDRHDELGSLVWEMTVQRKATPPAETLRSWADRIVAQATGLLEPLKVIEVDATRDEALLRSETPSPRKDKVAYYEVLLHGTKRAMVRRYQAAADKLGSREQVSFALTQEALAKLAEDVTLVLD